MPVKSLRWAVADAVEGKKGAVAPFETHEGVHEHGSCASLPVLEYTQAMVSASGPLNPLPTLGWSSGRFSTRLRFLDIGICYVRNEKSDFWGFRESRFSLRLVVSAGKINPRQGH